MLLNTVVKAVKRKSHRGSQSVTTDQITTDIVACVNESIRDLQKLLPKRYWHKSGTVALSLGVAGTPAVYSLASDCQEPIAFHFTSNSAYYKLEKVDSDKEWLNQIWSPTSPVNLPRYYREIGPNSSTGYKQIEVFPIPNGSITLNYEYYKTKGSDLTTSDLNTEIPNFPDHVQDAVEKGALYYFLKGFDDPNGEIAKRDYEEAKLALEISDERDMDSDLRLRFGLMRYDVPGFRLT